MFWRKKKEKEQDEIVFSYDYDESRVLYKNDFENELNGWIDRGPEVNHYDANKYHISVELSNEEKHGGSRCMKISGRRYGWNGATLNIIDYLRDDIFKYEAMVWVKIPADSKPCRVHLSLETNEKLTGGGALPHFGQWDDYCDYRNILSKYRLPVCALHDAGTESWETNYPQGYTTKDGWVLLRGRAEITKAHNLSVFAYIETNGDNNTSDIYVDDFVLLIGE
jgi:hypothetical protein